MIASRRKKRVNTRKVIIISSIVGVICGLLFVLGYFVLYRMNIGTTNLFNSGEFLITKNEEGNKVFPISYQMKNLDDELVSVSQAEGYYTIVNYFVTWNSFCATQIENLEKFKSENDDVRVIYVNVGEKEKNIEKFIEQKKLPIQKKDIIMDPKEEMYKTLEQNAFPVSVFVNLDGTISKISDELITVEDLETEYDNMKKASDHSLITGEQVTEHDEGEFEE